MFATPCLLLVGPLLLPMFEVRVAVIRITGTTNSFATPLLLLVRPAFLPTLKTCVAIEGSLRSGRGATALLMGTTPILFGFRPCLIPDGKLDVAIERSTCSACRVTTPSLLLDGPCRLPLVEGIIAIKGHVPAFLLAALTCVVTTPLFLLCTPTFLPFVIAGITIEGPTCVASRPTTKGLLLASPALLPMLIVHLAIEQHDRGGALTPLACMLTAP